MNIDLGRVIPLNKGVYSAVATYELNDIVAYNGNLYWCVSPTGALGVEPGTDSNIWKVSFTGDDLHTALQGYADTAVAAQEAAVTAKGQAETAKSQADEASRSAAQSAATAQTYATGEENSAKKYAEDAEKYRDRAMKAYDDAYSAYQQAEHEAESALGSATMAAQSETNAAESERNADESATNAAASVASIAEYAERAEAAEQNAMTETANARTFARNADESATTASNAATAAAASATNAATSERNAAQSATEAEGYKGEISSSLNRIQTNKANIDELYSSLNHLQDATLQGFLSITDEFEDEEKARKDGDNAIRAEFDEIARNIISYTSNEIETATKPVDKLVSDVKTINDRLYGNHTEDILTQASEELTTESDEVLSSYVLYDKIDSRFETTTDRIRALETLERQHFDVALETALININGERTRAKEAEEAIEESVSVLEGKLEAEASERQASDAEIEAKISTASGLSGQVINQIGNLSHTVDALESDVDGMRELLVTSATAGIADETGNQLATEDGEFINGTVLEQKTDKTLTLSGVPADAGAVGDKFTTELGFVRSDINDVSSLVATLYTDTQQRLTTETNRAMGAETTLRTDIANIRAEIDAGDTAVIEPIKTVLRKVGVDGLNDEAGGTILAEDGQDLQATTWIIGIPGEPYGDWSDAKTLQIPTPRLATVNFILPSMPVSKTADMNGYIQFWDGHGNYFQKEIIASAQGNSSLNFPKKNIKFDICNNNGWDDDDTFELRIGDWVPQDSFHLKAYMIDRFRGGAVAAYQLYDEIAKSRGFMKDRVWKKELIDYSGIATQIPVGSEGTIADNVLQTYSGARTYPDGFPCICYLNGTFYGIYSWQLKKSRANMQMTKKTTTHVHLDGTVRKDSMFGGTINWGSFEIRNPSPLYTMDGRKYDGDTNRRELIDERSNLYDSNNKDHKRSLAVKNYLIALSGVMDTLTAAETTYNASAKTTDDLAQFKSKIETYFDVENLIDNIIFIDVSADLDFHNNWQWVAYDVAAGDSNSLKWYMCPYDLDMSFGSYYAGDRIVAPRSAHVGTNDTFPPSYFILKYYLADVEARYKYLRDNGILSAEHITDLFNQWTERIGTDNYEAEFEKWKPGQIVATTATATYQSGVPNDNIYRLHKWTSQAITNMDTLYHYS